MKKNAFLISLLTFVFIFNSPAVLAQKRPVTEVFSVSPIIMKISLSPGKETKYDVRVKNLLKAPLPMHAEIEQPLETEETSGANSLAAWAHIDIPDMILQPGEQKTLKLTIKTPSKIPLGGYYGTLFLQPLMRAKSAGGSEILSRVGVIILANIGVPDLSAKARIPEFAIGKSVDNNRQRTADFKVKNLSLYHFSAKPFLVVNPVIGHTKTFEIPEKIILPGKLRTWNETIDWPYSFYNIYDIRLLVSVGNGNQILYQTRYYDLPYRGIALIVILSVIGIIAYKRRKKLRKALRVLIYNK
jgi:hypothetical protein